MFPGRSRLDRRTKIRAEKRTALSNRRLSSLNRSAGWTDGPDSFGTQIVLAADIVDHLIAHRIEKQSIDREIPPFGVLFRGGKSDHATDGVRRRRCHRPGTSRLRSGSGDAARESRRRRRRQPASYRTISPKRAGDVGCHVIVLGIASQQQIADAAAGKVRNVPGVAEPPQYGPSASSRFDRGIRVNHTVVHEGHEGHEGKIGDRGGLLPDREVVRRGAMRQGWDLLDREIL